mmetsp:Transcript_3738/g.7100  ORF Transcript_3738/g.7100 Transcript_3738/m.7100 type:complete len:263 (+) Transcript_3738:8620-9408(+)
MKKRWLREEFCQRFCHAPKVDPDRFSHLRERKCRPQILGTKAFQRESNLPLLHPFVVFAKRNDTIVHVDRTSQHVATPKFPVLCLDDSSCLDTVHKWNASIVFFIIVFFVWWPIIISPLIGIASTGTTCFGSVKTSLNQRNSLCRRHKINESCQLSAFQIVIWESLRIRCDRHTIFEELQCTVLEIYITFDDISVSPSTHLMFLGMADVVMNDPERVVHAGLKITHPNNLARGWHIHTSNPDRCPSTRTSLLLDRKRVELLL